MVSETITLRRTGNSKIGSWMLVNWEDVEEKEVTFHEACTKNIIVV